QTPEELLRVFLGDRLGRLWRQRLIPRFPKRERPNVFVPVSPRLFAQILAAVTISIVIQQGVKIFARNKRPMRYGAGVGPMPNRPFIRERVHRATIRRAVKR